MAADAQRRAPQMVTTCSRHRLFRGRYNTVWKARTAHYCAIVGAITRGRRPVAGLSGGDGVRLTRVQPHPDTSTITAKIGRFSEGLPLRLSECVPLRSHKTALL